MNDRKKILLVSANYPDIYNLWAPWNKYANIALSKIQEYHFEIVAPRPYMPPLKFFPYYKFRNIPIKYSGEEGLVHHPRFIYLLPKKYFYKFTGGFYRISISKYLEKNIEKVSLVHSHHSYPDGYGLINFCKKRKIPMIVEIHGDMLISNLIKNKGLAKKNITTFNFSSKIICISKKIYHFAEKNGISKKKLEYIPLGVDIKGFKPRDKEILRRDLNFKEEKIILFVGRLTTEKGIFELIMAFKKLLFSTKTNNVRLIITGYGPDENRIKSYAKELNIFDKITFTGSLYGEELEKFYALSDIFVLPSYNEGRPMVINEAMASECAIIATNVGGIPEQIIDGVNGYVIEPRDNELLFNKMNFLIQNEKIMERMGLNSRKRVIEEGWTWEDYAKKVNLVYTEIIE